MTGRPREGPQPGLLGEGGACSDWRESGRSPSWPGSSDLHQTRVTRLITLHGDYAPHVARGGANEALRDDPEGFVGSGDALVRGPSCRAAAQGPPPSGYGDTLAEG